MLSKVFAKTSKTILFSVLVGLFGAILCITPLGLSLEEEIGLAWLFTARGEVSPPHDVIIISIDQGSAEALKFDDNPDKWPRENYVQLLDNINRQHPAIVALDVVFKDDRDPLIDRQLADAVAQNGNVVLSSYLKHKIVPMSGNTTAVSYESIVESIASVSSAAIASAPFLLPKTASTVKQFWINKDSAGDLRTFPDAVFQCFVFKTAYSEIIALLKDINPTMAAQLPASFAELASGYSILDTIERIQAEFVNQDSPVKLAQRITAAKFSAKQQALLEAWFRVLDNKSLYLNHYGDVGTIITIPFYEAIKNLPAGSLRDKVVVIGYSETIEPEKNPGFYSVFSKANNQTISAAEIAATAIGNLIDNVWLRPLNSVWQFSLLLVWGILLSIICLLCPYRLAIGLILILGGLYVYGAYYAFVTAHLWFPLLIPIALQMPLIIIGVSIMHFHRTDRTKHKMQSVLHNLLPKDIVATIPNQARNGVMDTSAKLMHGVCMATDICDYTKLSEALEANELIALMNSYYETLFPVVAEYQGYVTDLAGDGMYAIWPNPESTRQAHNNACNAALLINSALNQLNKSLENPLFTRIGLSCGEISIGHTGTPGRYVYRAIGDPVNTASRVESLNKHLGTQILVTDLVAADLQDFLFRDLGLFRLKGKMKPVHVFELMGTMAGSDGAQQKLVMAFTRALALFQKRQWENALAAFKEINQDFPEDRPTRFFISYINPLVMAKKPVSTNAKVIIDIK